ncbi:hypothetical protein GGR34_000575 [Microvirga flocculans]|uniref:Uncharacterized protein n=1 Tax=Microvirga flocculans TaxID=217168 RepID=A0A7W6N702_9HYPH|nr:hypothetical protein [Microvirga flocculans]MBB4038940.1 hypothetical protein [Microvirga flocculans]
MRLYSTLALFLALAPAAAQAQSMQGQGICPPNLRPNGAFCVVSIAASIRNPGICPPEYVSTADGMYCVLAPRNQWVLAKPDCPGGTKASLGGEHCAGQQAADATSVR